MNETKHTKPRLEYEEVVKFIDERIIRIERIAERIESEHVEKEDALMAEKPAAPPSDNWWSRCNARLRRCFKKAGGPHDEKT